MFVVVVCGDMVSCCCLLFVMGCLFFHCVVFVVCSLLCVVCCLLFVCLFVCFRVVRVVCCLWVVGCWLL